MFISDSLEDKMKNRGTPHNVASKEKPFIFPYVKGIVDSFLPLYDLQAYRENGIWYIKPMSENDYEKIEDTYSLSMLDYHYTVISFCQMRKTKENKPS